MYETSQYILIFITLLICHQVKRLVHLADTFTKMLEKALTSKEICWEINYAILVLWCKLQVLAAFSSSFLLEPNSLHTDIFSNYCYYWISK